MSATEGVGLLGLELYLRKKWVVLIGQTGVGVGSTELGGSGTARTMVVSRVEVGRTVRQRFILG